MEINDIKKLIAPSEMMTEDGKNELYLYSFKKMADRNAEVSRYSLTGLYGSVAFFYKANECLHSHLNDQYALIRMDIYRFKTINEFCGRANGDKLLVHISDCFKKYESKDSVVGHLRADIFTLCTPYKTDQDLINIVNDIAKQIEVYPLPCKILPAFGICKSEFGMDISLLIDYANLALQTVKGRVFSCYAFYNETLRQQLLYEKKIENEIIPALNNHELEVYIQPKVNMRNEEIIGGEALLRWNHPLDGFLLPDQFIPILEKSGYIVDVDKYVWEEVFRSLRQWIDNGYKVVPISLNVSRLHSYQTDFEQVLYGLAKKYNISHNLIQLELTESALTEHTDLVFKTLNNLQNNGFYISMDDFGSGYSSMNMLKDEPIDEIKIDRVFLTDISTQKSRIIIKHMISMMTELNINIIAEGIETPEQANFMLECGCYNAQGFLYHRPMPMTQFKKLLPRF